MENFNEITNEEKLRLYKGIAASDKFLHNHINEILNLFNDDIVKIMSNAKVAKYVWKDGVKTNEIIGYDEFELNRNEHGSANLLVKRNKGQYYTSSYFYVTKSIIYQENEQNPYLTIPIEFVKVCQAHKDNVFLAYSHLDDLWFMVDYGKISEYYTANCYNEKAFYRYKGYQYLKYELDLSKGHKLDKTPHQNAKYFENAHIGVTRYSKSISGKHCWLKVFSKASGNPTTKNGKVPQPTEFKSLKEAYEMLCKWTDLGDKMSVKTFIRKVRFGEIFEFDKFLFQVVENENELLDKIEVFTQKKDRFAGVVDVMASMDIIVSLADIAIAEQLNMSVEEFQQYCIERYSKGFDTLKECVAPEDLETLDFESSDKSESWYRNLQDTNYSVDDHIGDDENES